MTVDVAQFLQFGALGVLLAVLIGVGFGVKLWATQSKGLTELIVGVVSKNSEVVSVNTAAIASVHEGLEGVRRQMSALTVQIAGQPCQAEAMAERLEQEARERMGLPANAKPTNKTT